MYRKTLVLSLLLSSVMLVSGCGTKQPSPSVTQKGTQAGQKVIAPAAQDQYSGAENYKKFEGLAAKNPKDINAQIAAGMSAYSNKDYTNAIKYYKQAIVLNPGSGIANNNLGNIYYTGLNDPKTAIPYYVKATETKPSYGYAWVNLVFCQKALGDISGAKTTISKGLKVLNSGDASYKSLIQLQSQLK